MWSQKFGVTPVPFVRFQQFILKLDDDDVSNHNYICWRTSLDSIDPEPHMLGTREGLMCDIFQVLKELGIERDESKCH